MSLNRRLYAWLLGSDIKGNTIVPESEISNSYEDQSSYFFEKYSKDLLVEVKEHFWKVHREPGVPDHACPCFSLQDLKTDTGCAPWYTVGKFCVLTPSVRLVFFLSENNQ